MKHDISVVMMQEDMKLDQLVSDLESLNLEIVGDESNDDWVIFRYELSDEELDSLLTFVKASPYAQSYEVECWDSGDCEFLWNNLSL